MGCGWRTPIDEDEKGGQVVPSEPPHGRAGRRSGLLVEHLTRIVVDALGLRWDILTHLVHRSDVSTEWGWANQGCARCVQLDTPAFRSS